MEEQKITLAHGSGGRATSQLIGEIFAAEFHNEVLARMEDAAVVSGSGTIAVTTDSFVVDPLVFPGGDIGELAVCGTVNDLLMSGAEPRYLTCGFILEEGADLQLLRRIAHSMGQTARAAGVQIVAGDTKVIGGNGGIYINTAGVGFVPQGRQLRSANCRVGDRVLLSGTLGDHHAAILSARMGIENTIRSDCAALVEPVQALWQAGIEPRCMRDVTRGGLATVLNEIADACGHGVELEQTAVSVDAQVRGFCAILGLDPLYMGNEGKFIAVLPPEQAETALEVLRALPQYRHAALVGTVTDGEQGLFLRTEIGGLTRLDVLYGEGLPRIC